MDTQPLAPDEAEQWQEAAVEPLPRLSEMLDVLRRRCGIDFSGYKSTTLTRRARQRMARLSVTSSDDYLKSLQEQAGEREALCGELLVNVTEFFRDAQVFRQLEGAVLPDLLRGRDAGDDLRIWCAGCASGEEAYSVAMLALEAAGRLGFHGNVKVFATDLDAPALAQASRGSYGDDCLAPVPEALRRRYLQADPAGGMRADPTLRRHLVFARHNLLSDPPFTCIDLALCRNLLIYLKPEMQFKALSRLHFALKPQGLLLLGASENVGAFESNAFSAVDRSHKLFRKQPAVLARNFEAPTLGAQAVPALPARQPSAEGQAADSLAAELDATRERLHEMVLELQASHERLDLSNEELTASNEELQSTNEELKSVNEDLYALNKELEARNDELDALNRDYDHLLDSTEIGTVFLDGDLNLRRFSPGVEDFLSLRASDMGRPIGDIRYRLGAQEDFLQDLRACAASGKRLEREAMLPDGRWVFERMLPFQNGADESQGVVLTWTDISKIKHIESLAETLAADRARLLSILEALPDGVHIVNAQHELEYVNPVLKREFGEVDGRKCHEYFLDSPTPCTWCNIEKVLAGQTVQRQWVSPRGRTYDLFDIPLTNADGSVSKLELFHDVTDMQEARRRLDEAARIARVGHWEWNIPTDELSWSDETFACFGFLPGAFTPTFERFLQQVVPDDRKRVQDGVAQALRQDEACETEFRFRRSDGSLGVGFSSGRVERDAQGKPVKLSGAMQDISGLRESELRFKVAFRASPMAASIARVRDGVFVEVNDRYETWFGWSVSDLVGRSTLEVGLWADLEVRAAWLAELQHRGSTLDFEAEWVCKSGEKRCVSLSAELMDLHDEPHVVAFAQDITERKESAARIEFLAHHDPLTGLPNRVLFRDRFELARAWTERSNHKLALLYLDLDHFKQINDTLGHPVGDLLLKQVAQRLAGTLRDTDTISRQGGDEFLIALTDVQDVEGVGRIASKITEALAHPFDIEGHQLAVTLSIGIALCPDDGADFDTLLQRADTAMYRAKESGRNTYCFYTSEMNAQALENLKMRSALHWALDQQEFVLHYQPQIDLVSGKVIGVEALLRWQRADGELVPPGRFVPAAEESGQIVPIGEWALREACAQAVRWQQAGLPELTMAVNLSAVQFRRGDLLASVTQALEESGLDPSRLELELTESLLMEDVEATLRTVQRFKALGVSLAIDDFGTGYSSLAYLRRFSVDKLKIDQSFVRDIVSDPEDAAIVRAVISMARSLKLRVVAEGVESAEVARILNLYHCQEAQGYHFARPMPAQALADWMRERSEPG
ncbi:MAG: EAL domain-containing protein [Burkholderiaceae bacterium]|nr:EAL domain-containing protein [Burkholderiaceae bacterium]